MLIREKKTLRRNTISACFVELLHKSTSTQIVISCLVSQSIYPILELKKS